MTRPKVDPDKRQRTAQACDSCKRRKQKCNGLCPCNTCSKRSLSCTYTTSEHGLDEATSPKRRLTEGDVDAFQAPRASQSPAIVSTPQRLSMQSPGLARELAPSWGYSQEANSFGDAVKPTAAACLGLGLSSLNNAQPAIGTSSQATAASRDKGSLAPQGTTHYAQDEEAVVYSSTRMLQDPTGRLLYIGDSASLSYLQLIRMIVENVSGPSPFTTDPRRHRIMEPSLKLPPGLRQTHLLPDKQTADLLVTSFFTNTHGLLEVFDEEAFLARLQACYQDPLTTDPSWLCLLNLVFAIGLLLATPPPASDAATIIGKLRTDPMDRAEVFYLNAKSLNDPCAGFEDADFWSIQALLLMTLYMLEVSKRNAAYAYFGMAVRSAFALGLHREETMVIYCSEEKQVRRKVWRSLFVFDRFLSASMGRPTAISEDDCSGDSLWPSDDSTQSLPTASQLNSLGLAASVRSCRVIGIVLKRVYQQRRISTKLAQEIADTCKLWPKTLSPVLHWHQASSVSARQGIAILHVNILYCHSIILLTRPFFLYLLNSEIQKGQKDPSQRSQRIGGKMEQFSEACVIASNHTLLLVQNAYEGGYLQRRNPVVIYFLFAAALIILSNEFSSLCANPAASLGISNSISLMTYCADSDPQAQRLLYILTTFRDVVNNQQERSWPRIASQADETMVSFFTGVPAHLDPILPNKEKRTVRMARKLSDSKNGAAGSDTSTLSNTLATSSNGSSAPDEAIDFDALWAWPAATAAAAAPGYDAGVQGISDSAVPLFGMRDPE